MIICKQEPSLIMAPDGKTFSELECWTKRLNLHLNHCMYFATFYNRIKEELIPPINTRPSCHD